jgi:hypothetical protein
VSLVGDHARTIRAAIKAAEKDGLKFEFEVGTERDGEHGIGFDVVQYEYSVGDRGRWRAELVDWQEIYWEETGEF